MAPNYRHGRGAALYFDSTANALVNFSSGLNEFTLSREMDTAEVSHFGLFDRTYVAGLRGGTISFAGMFSSTHAEVLDGIFNRNSTATLSFEINPDGSTAVGRHLLKGESLLTSLEYTAAADDMVGLSGELTITGAVVSTNN